MNVDLFKLLDAAEKILPLWDEFERLPNKRDITKVAPLVAKALRALVDAGVTPEGLIALAESPRIGALIALVTRR
jgi:hypothetical protein